MSRTKTHGRPACVDSPWIEWKISFTVNIVLLFYGHGETRFLHEAHLNDLQERQKFSGYGRFDVREIDINKEPPSREFLEKHIESDHFLDYVSTRSPVFKERPLPKSKKEAIDLMVQNPNLIRRPILIQGSQVLFGFDKDTYGKLYLRIGTSGWNYPSGRGTWNGVFYPPARPAARLRRARLLR